MSWIADALSLGQAMANDPGASPYVMSAGYNTAVSRFTVSAPSNASGDITVEMDDTVTTEYTVTGDNIEEESGTVDSGDFYSFEVPPGATNVVVEFTMFNTSFDTASDLPETMGSLTFSNINIPDLVVQGDLLMFGATDGVRVINAEAALEGIFPLFGESQNLTVKSGILTKKGNINLGSV